MRSCLPSIALLAVVAILAGCAQRSLYSWGGYDSLLYQQYKDPAKAVQMRIQLETHVAELEKNQSRVPPGIYAELGTLYMQAGDNKRAIELYGREASTWPESKGLMSAMTSALERREATGKASQ